MGSLQMFVLSVFLAVSVLIILVFLFVFKSSREQGELVNPNRKREVFFLTLAVIALTVIGTTFPKSPYFLYKSEKPQMVVFVVAKKFAFGLEKDGSWIFGVSSQKDINRLVKATGFTVTWDPKTGEYDHPALLIGVDDEGRIMRRLIGFQEVRMLADVVRDLKREFVPFYSIPDKNVLLRCFDYDPESGEWGFSWGFLLIALPAILAFGIVISIWMISVYRRKRPAEIK